MSERVVVIGAGHAAGLFAEALRKEGFEGEIVLLGEESHLPYQRPPLSKDFLAGKMAVERLSLRNESFYDKKDITLKLGVRVSMIDRSAAEVVCADGTREPYDTLVIATGTRVRELPTDGADADGVYYIRTIDDVVRLKSKFETAENIVVIGAGFIGLEVAAVAATAGKSVSVVERENRFMPRVVAPFISSFYESYHAKEGVHIHLDENISRVESDSGGVTGVRLESGEVLPADIVVVGIGVIPNVELADAAGLDVTNGIVVDETALTSDPNIYAIGECALHPNRIFGDIRLESVQNAQDQAKVAAANIVGKTTTYDVVPWFWSNQYDLRLQMTGLSTGYDDLIIRGDVEDAKFSVIYLKEGEMIAVDSINAAADHMAARKLIHEAITPTREELQDMTKKLKEYL